MNATMKNTTTNTNGTTITPLGNLAKTYALGESKAKAMSATAFETAGVTEKFSKIAELSGKIYAQTGLVQDLRAATANNDPEGNLTIAAETATLRKLLAMWFLSYGSRPAKKAVEESGKKETRRPLYAVTASDLIILGNSYGTAQAKATKTCTAENKFFEYLFVRTGNIVAGKPFGLVSDDDLAKANSAANIETAKKSAETKAENKAKKQADAKAKDEKIEQLEKQLADTISMADMLDAYVKSLAKNGLDEKTIAACLATFKAECTK